MPIIYKVQVHVKAVKQIMKYSRQLDIHVHVYCYHLHVHVTFLGMCLPVVHVHCILVFESIEVYHIKVHTGIHVRRRGFLEAQQGWKDIFFF